ncbi:hypothetical protein A3A01_01975 [Candidatus Nomurabacteria bacterium RIFCSPLOWO2_01_FULL_39_17]|uniref:Carbohydrate kinase PfkB domain-containing protein n=1 Tax=Candidatus Nomurabacteria bacterium RIFCSPLOWO2_01_FULL_39_17 TaxID=1801770 RepID=A0A1F6WUQ6_9BACT|nr:MAG: hypothetical protein A3A01_01975 [Candidatus Nomurabacteria bacterium RIFCSPLOWO2_01_FULL_39_17]
MKVAVLGPITKDTVIFDGISQMNMGGIPYFEANVLKALGAEVEAFITYAREDEEWVKENFLGIKIYSIYADQTLEGDLLYSPEDPDTRRIIRLKYGPNIISPEEDLINTLRNFDYILLGPLYYENIHHEFFEKLKDKNLVLGNFGLFTYHENGNMVWKNPEKLVQVAKFLKYLFLDEKEIKFVAQKETTEECAEYFLFLGVKIVAITGGSKGSLIFTKDKKYTIPAFPVKTLADPTGAGDTYVAAFIFATSLFDDIQKQGEFAAMVATMVVEKRGAFNGNLETVLTRLKEFQK